MIKRIFILLSLFLSFVGETYAQYSFNKTVPFNMYKNNMIYVYPDSTADTVKSVVLKNLNMNDRSPQVVVILEEIGLGSVMGTMFSLSVGGLSALVESRIDREDSYGPVVAGVVGMAIGVSFGYSYGIYLFAKSEKRKASLWEIFASELIGIGTGFGINQATHHKGIGRWTPIILPISIPIVYVELRK